MTAPTPEQIEAAIKELNMAAGIADTFHGRNCCAALDTLETAIASLQAEVAALKEQRDTATAMAANTISANLDLKAEVVRKDGLLKQLKTNSNCSEHQLLIINEAIAPAEPEVKS